MTDVVADLDDRAGELVPERQRWLDPVLGPLVPDVDVQVGAADRRGLDLDEHLVAAGDGDGHLLEREPGARLELAHRPHRLHGRRIAAPRARAIRRTADYI